METRKLQYPEFPNPILMRSFPIRTVVENGAVKFGSDVLRFTDEGFEDGTEVVISANRFWIDCQSVADIEREKQRQEIERQARIEEARIREEIRKAQNKIFNESLNVPVLWSPDNKVVMSGLSERSSGNGCFAKTVIHVILREPLTEGRIKRGKGDFLCTQPKAKHSFHPTEFWDDTPPTLRSAKVNCRKCLEICERWSAN